MVNRAYSRSSWKTCIGQLPEGLGASTVTPVVYGFNLYEDKFLAGKKSKKIERAARCL